MLHGHVFVMLFSNIIVMIQIYIAYCRHHRPRHLTNSTGSPGVNNLSKSIKPKSITLQVLQLQLYLNEKENSYPCLFADNLV